MEAKRTSIAAARARNAALMAIACKTANDCGSAICTNNVCQVPQCPDGVKNGTETDTDCGGSCSTRCAPGQSCKAGSDCTSATCTNNICQCPPGMTTVPILGSGTYCIDTTEVTYGAYKQFINKNPPIGNQPPYCNARTRGRRMRLRTSGTPLGQ